jgi:hypothetical protein
MMAERKSYYRHVKNVGGQDSFWQFYVRYTYDAYKAVRLRHIGKSELPQKDDLTIKAFVAGYVRVMKAFMEDETSLSVDEIVDVWASIIPEDYRHY